MAGVVHKAQYSTMMVRLIVFDREEPWCVIDGPMSRRELYAYEVSMTNPQTSKVWWAIVDWLESQCYLPWSKRNENKSDITSDEHEEVELRPAPPDMPPPSRLVLTPKPPTPPPPLTATATHSPVVVMPPTVIMPPSEHDDGQHERAKPSSAAGVEGTVNTSAYLDAPPEPWATTVSGDATIWSGVLRQHGVDETASQ